jgi:DeoR/GlpR family transcriptional regulator of sugar metabolism
MGQASKKDVSIKDISLVLTDCSEKTIQRELNSLVLKGQLKKTGAKRWSRYSIT